MTSSSAAEAGEAVGRLNLLADSLVLDAWREYFETAQRLTTRLDAELKSGTGLSLSDYNLLLVLVEAPNRTLRMSVLADRLVFSAPRLNYRIGVLEEKGWVVKSASPDDRRAHLVTLTDEGFRRFLGAGRVHRAHIEKFFESALQPGDAEHILRISAAIDSNLG
ncbi:MarR family winged helix-turn-helix transcriptional regulator [Brevibacterium daeguense]|uniref:MarR family winged helix-turn-helix transcriptional regulator n=1 Tax=Brevibacterium daeguense TaxID=909936 RepID=A0ABP8ELW7_9MICO|nr:MarR family transcriptional regulator [Brevibacterium daeguense]